MDQGIYAEYTSSGTSVREYMVEVSDGVKLKIIDFDPGAKKGSPIILFVAGWISLISGWKGFLQEITPKFRTLYLDTREKYTSQVPPKKRVSYDTERLRLDLREVIGQVIPAKTPYVMAGSSLGATAIMEYMTTDGRMPECSVLILPNADFRFPKLLTRIVMLIHPSLYFIAKPIVKWYLRNFRLDMKKAAEQMKKYEGTLDAADPYKLKANAIALIGYSIWDRLGKITTPCLIVGATTDTLHGTEKIERMMEVLPRAEYVEMESNLATHGNDAGRMMAEYVTKKKYRKL
jgi:pimeloyl-ACP methyl ester carboxylesterase